MTLTLDFEPWNHTYTLINGDQGDPLHSVTGITNIKDKPALHQWQLNQVSRYAAVHSDVINLLPEDDAYELIRKSVSWNLDRNADRGQTGHAEVEAMLKDGKEPEGYAHAAAAFLTETGFYVLPDEVERRLAHPELGYAGTADVYQPTQRVIDWKTKPDPSKNLYPDQAMQLVGYASATHLADQDTGHLTPIITPVTEAWAVALFPDTTWKAWSIDLTEDFWAEAWFGMVDLHRHQKAIEKGWKRL